MISIFNGGPRRTRPMWTEAVSEAEASGKEEWNIPHIPVQQRQRLNDKVDPTVKEHLECISKNWCNYFAESETSSSSASRSKPTTCWDQSWNDQHQWKECPEKSSPFSVAMSLLNIDEHTLTSFLSAPSAPSLRFFCPPVSSRTSTGLAVWLTGPQTQVMSPTSASTPAQTSQRSTTRWTTSKRKLPWDFQISSHTAGHKAAAANLWQARYRQCLVPVWLAALGNWCVTVFLKQVCFLNQQDPGN